MNLTAMSTRIKLDMGIYGIALPIVNVEDMIIDILRDITLPTFSVYCPYKDILFINLKDLEQIERNPLYSAYLLPETINEILSVRDVKYVNQATSGGTVGCVPNYYGYEGIKEVILANAGKLVSNEIYPTLTFKFVPKRTLKLFNLVESGDLSIELELVHDKSFMSIPATAEESFYKLALLDVENGMYGMVKHSSTLQTAIANIDLKVDDWANAKSERAALIEKWDDEKSLDNKEYYG